MNQNQISKEWFEFAKSDLKNAGILFENKSYRDCIWYCHQAVEKLLKAIIANQSKRIPKVHDLLRLLEEVDFARNETVSKFLEELNPYYIPVRYPEAGFKFKVIYGKKSTQEIFYKTREVFKWLRLGLNHNR